MVETHQLAALDLIKTHSGFLSIFQNTRFPLQSHASISVRSNILEIVMNFSASSDTKEAWTPKTGPN